MIIKLSEMPKQSDQLLALLNQSNDQFGVDVTWQPNGKIGVLKKKRFGLIEPFDIYQAFVDEGALPGNALRATCIAGLESGFNGLASNDIGAMGLFQGIQKFGWPSAVSANLSDHLPMIRKMISYYKLSSRDLTFDRMYAKHFLDRRGEILASGHRGIVRPSSLKNGAWFGQFLVEFANGDTMTDLLFAALFNISKFSTLVDHDTLLCYYGSGSDATKVAVMGVEGIDFDSVKRDDAPVHVVPPSSSLVKVSHTWTEGGSRVATSRTPTVYATATNVSPVAPPSTKPSRDPKLARSIISPSQIKITQ